MLIKMVVTQLLKGNQKGTRRIVCPEYTLNHTQWKKQHLYTSNPRSS